MKKQMVGKLLVVCALSISSSVVNADGNGFELSKGTGHVDADIANAERASAARGHYARAKTMLLEALSEFEQGRQIARPDLLIDSDAWRQSVMARTDELSKVLNPEARVSVGGERYKENYGILRDVTKSVKPAVVKKSQPKKKITYSRARMGNTAQTELPKAKPVEPTITEESKDETLSQESSSGLARQVLAPATSTAPASNLTPPAETTEIKPEAEKTTPEIEVPNVDTTATDSEPLSQESSSEKEPAVGAAKEKQLDEEDKISATLEKIEAEIAAQQKKGQE